MRTSDRYLLIAHEGMAITEAPDEIVVLPDGVVVSDHGRIVVDEAAVAAVLANVNARLGCGHRLQIDYEHQSLGGPYKAPNGQAPAAGWIHALRHEKGRGFIASVRWTPAARKAVAEQEYMFLSPVTVHDRKNSNRLVGIASVALTNTPAIRAMPPLTAAHSAMFVTPNTENETMDDNGLKMLREKLGLGEDAGMEAILAAISKLKEPSAEQVANTARLAEALKLIGLPADADATTIKAHAAKTTGAASDLTQRVNTLEAQLFDTQFTALLAPYEAKGALPEGSKALRESIAHTARTSGLPAAKTILDELPVVIPQGRLTPTAGAAPAGSTGEQKLIDEAIKAHNGDVAKAYGGLQARLLKEEEQDGQVTRAHAIKVCSVKYPNIFAESA